LDGDQDEQHDRPHAEDERPADTDNRQVLRLPGRPRVSESGYRLRRWQGTLQ